MRLSLMAAAGFMILTLTSLVLAQTPTPRDPGGIVPPRPRDPGAHPRPTPPIPRDPNNPDDPNDPNNPNQPPTPRWPDPTPPTPRPPTPRPPTPRPPTPRPPTPRPPEPRLPEPGLPSESVFTAQNVARNQARMMANRVVAVYGRAEQVLYSFSLGLNQGIASYNFENGGIQQNSDFQMAAQQGRAEGQSEGFARGEREGQVEGSAAGVSSAAIRFEAVIDTGATADLNPRVPQIAARGYQANIANPPSLEDLLNRHNDELYLILNGYEYSYEDYYARNIWSGELVTMAQLYGWRSSFGFNRFIDSYSRDEWAFGAWLNYALGGRYQNEVRYYNRVTDPSQVSNAAEIRTAFAREFKRTYRETIDDKWMSSVRRVDPIVQARGLQLGYKVAREHASDLGRVFGYRDVYPTASAQGYQSSYANAYVAGFNKTISYYQQNVVVSDAVVRMTTNDGSPFLPWAPLSLKIDRLRNAGQLSGEVTIQLNGGFTQSFQKKTRVIKASASDSVPQVIDWAGQITGDVWPDQTQSVEVSLGSYKTRITYTVSFYDVIRALGATGAVQGAGGETTRLALQEYVRKNLVNEYETGAQETLLNELVSAYNSSQPNEKSVIAQSRDIWRSALGRQPGLFSAKRGRWQRAQTQLNQLR